jgi:hypothetical protein
MTYLKDKSPGEIRALKSRVALPGAIYRLKIPIRGLESAATVKGNFLLSE